MKKFIFTLLTIAVFTTANAQDYKKSSTIGIHFILNDFKTAAQLRANGLSDVLNTKQYSNTKRMAPGMAISYIQGLCEQLDFAATLSGSFVDYPVPDNLGNGSQNLLLEAVATANLKLVSDKYWFVPFLTAGVGASKYKGYYGAIMPVGLGIQLRLSEETIILINSQYRIPVTNNTTAYHFYHSFGVGFGFKKKAAAPATEVSLSATN
jgi:hypothetical protein